MQKINLIIKEVKKAAKYYIANKEVLREGARNRYRNLSEKENEKRNRYHMIDLNEELRQYQRNYYASKKINKILFCCTI